MKTLKTCPAFNAKLKDFLIVGTEKPKIFLIPRRDFTDLVVQAGRRFKTLAPLAPYPNFLGCDWKTSKSVYEWMVRRLEEIQERYNYLFEDDGKETLGDE